MHVALVDYGAGNLASVRKAFATLRLEVVIPLAPGDLHNAAGIVVPGVGHFSATAVLGDPWREAILERVEAGVPLLGICLGMQWMFAGSAEAPELRGLGLFEGICTRIQAGPPLKVPHVGWNTLTRHRESVLLRGVPEDAHMYFTHTFAAPVTAECVATATHGQSFSAAAGHDHVWGVQFHPELSAGSGLQLLRNFAHLVEA